MKRISLIAVIAIAMAVGSCTKNDNRSTKNEENNPIAPDNFTFATSKEVSLTIKLLTNDDKPLTGVMVNVYTASDNSNLLYTGLTNESGSIVTKLNIASYIDTLVVDPAYIGLMRNALTVIDGNNSVCIIGGSQGFGGNVVASADIAGSSPKKGTTAYENGAGNSPNIFYLGKYDYNGRPLDRSASDVITPLLLETVNNSLPENKPVPIYHPEYLKSNTETKLNLLKQTDLWVTFVSEGAGYLNSLGYYTYKTANPPKSVSDISKITIVMPNASLSGSGGNMVSGDKVYLGRFSSGNSIGFVLLQNAWNKTTQTVNESAKMFFANDNLNAEVEAEGYLRHTVLLWDETHNVYLQGFEDLQRDNKSSDDDFNDLVFYTTSSVTDAVEKSSMNISDVPVDSDKDGVYDEYDMFPKDASRAYIQYYPSKNTWGTLAFEDLWPNTGDYDLNDLVTGYQYTYIKNAKNAIVDMYADYNIKAVGASFINGFGVELPFPSSAVSSVTGQKLKAGYIKQNANGTEAGQTKAVIIPFDDTRALYPSGGFTNVYSGRPTQKSDTSHVYIKFTAPLSESELGVAPFNPFLISGQRRGYEVHLAGTKPTSLGDTKLLGTADDNSLPLANRYYLSAKNWPWALNFTESFDYPSEGNNVSLTYLNFLAWAKSGGTLFTDWYQHTAVNVNESLVYKK